MFPLKNLACKGLINMDFNMGFSSQSRPKPYYFYV